MPRLFCQGISFLYPTFCISYSYPCNATIYAYIPAFFKSYELSLLPTSVPCSEIHPEEGILCRYVRLRDFRMRIHYTQNILSHIYLDPESRYMRAHKSRNVDEHCKKAHPHSTPAIAHNMSCLGKIRSDLHHFFDNLPDVIKRHQCNQCTYCG